ncbi:hypothetical protein KQ51_00260 [Candidatus Izimaplasma bacterium HR1]|jgi:hypothetical protein|uniref:hypothetical protein n=1 Tax=Candidatus Izimoplasma sp. HR1 TaxID=1541959 RepID=UPI0004F8136B|nr:hypothetical protein KQ51_00260 [Candidatus Izimaplasma bacterium HR1]
MNNEIFIEKYKKFGISEEDVYTYLGTIVRFEEYVKKDISETTIKDIERYFEYLISIKENTYGNVVHFARYYYYINKKEEYIHMTKYFNSLGVLESILNRITLYETKELQNQIIKNIDLPPFGLSSEELPKYTKDFMDKLSKYLPRVKCDRILAGNNHKIPESSFDKEKEYYSKSSSLKEYLRDKHVRKVEELKHHLANNTVWFEQIITKEAIEYVESNQEILSGIIENDKLYVTKIPYEISKFLETNDEVLKRYYACHCSFVRENILKENVDIPKEWCYCSAGFAKYPFEVILGKELNVKLLKTPIDGDYICRFEIDLADTGYKKL